MMNKLILLGILCLAGCQSTTGPLQYRQPVRVDDPRLPIGEQERLGRDRFSLPDHTYEAGPDGGLVPPSLGGSRIR